ncbi:MAG: hypothetical protein ING73_14345 [Rhodocyclaceae bacterium]|nr:hypothetical protein [Rhodocyclaceae bacterium]
MKLKITAAVTINDTQFVADQQIETADEVKAAQLIEAEVAEAMPEDSAGCFIGV